jgi:hypothetical protein
MQARCRVRLVLVERLVTSNASRPVRRRRESREHREAAEAAKAAKAAEAAEAAKARLPEDACIKPRALLEYRPIALQGKAGFAAARAKKKKGAPPRQKRKTRSVAPRYSSSLGRSTATG